MSYPEFFEITKIDAARRQLRTAIELWFADGDPISIHTLAAAAYQIIHDLNRRNKGPDLLLDSKYIKDEKRREFVSLVKSTSNFMKHADRGKMGMAKSIEFSSDSNVGLITFFFGLQYLGEKLAAEEIAFERWQIFRNPDLMTDAGKALFEKRFTVNQVSAMRAVPKREFLDAFRSAFRQPGFDLT